MFEYLSSYDKILVSGQARSGTLITTTMIAYDLHYKRHDERWFGVIDTDRLRTKLKYGHQIAVHCPALLEHLETFAAPDTALVVVWRNLDDIIASSRRICHYPQMRWAADRRGMTDKEYILSRYRRWNEASEDLDNIFSVQYESLDTHPLWLPKEARAHFEPLQTMLNERRPGSPPLRTY